MGANNWDTECPKRGACGLHCACFTDIDEDFKGCLWCNVMEENTGFTHSIVELGLDIKKYKDALYRLAKGDAELHDVAANQSFAKKILGES
jgi:hypothetical protein